MGNLGIPDFYGDGCQALSDLADPVVPAHRGEGLGDRFVECFRRHVELMRGVVQVADNDAIQMLLMNTLEPILRGEKLEHDHIAILFRQVQTTKAVKAQELLARRRHKQEE
jgi:ribosome-binding ATPase YchF (GTP1/OBG family)